MANAQGKGRGGKNNFPTKIPEPQTIEELRERQRLLKEALHAYRMPKVTSDKELADRFDEYFEWCIENDVLPTIEEMFLYTGYGYNGLYDIETGRSKGFSPNTSKIIKKAREIIKSIDAKMTASGEINPIVYFFRAKNYYGMVDKVEHVIAPMTETELIDTTTIRDRYLLPEKKD